MMTSAKSAVPTVTDQAAAMQLGQCAKNLATCLAELRTATQKVSIHNTGRDNRIHLTGAGNLLLSLVKCCLIARLHLGKPSSLILFRDRKPSI